MSVISFLSFSPGIKCHIVLRSQSSHEHNHLNTSQVFLKCSAFGGRPAVDVSAIFRGIYISRLPKRHLSRSRYWLLIRDCSTKSTSTKSTEAETETQEQESPFVSKHVTQIQPSILYKVENNLCSFEMTCND